MTDLFFYISPTDYRDHLVTPLSKQRLSEDSDYDTDDLIEDARNFVLASKR